MQDASASVLAAQAARDGTLGEINRLRNVIEQFKANVIKVGRFEADHCIIDPTVDHGTMHGDKCACMASARLTSLQLASLHACPCQVVHGDKCCQYVT